MSCLTGVLLLELGLGSLVKPSDDSFGTLFGRELPPIKIVKTASPPPPTDLGAPYRDLVVDGQRLTIGDLWGFHEEHPVIGYINAKNMTSTNGWWQSNNLGARSRRPVASDVDPGKTRVLVFGESFGHGSRLRQEETWSSIININMDNAEFINFAVDGYSMAQSLLYYRMIAAQIQYDVVILMFIPDADLWRDINTIRALGEDWAMPPAVMPRFVLDSSANIVLAVSPYRTRLDFHEANFPALSLLLKHHLREFDRFYFKTKYENPPLFQRSILYKIAARIYYQRYAYNRVWRDVMNVDGEAVQVSRRVFAAMKNAVMNDGASFMLVVLPADIWSFKDSGRLVEKWKIMTSSICEEVICLDLMDKILAIAPSNLDRGYDGTHYGPQVNRVIAKAVREYLGKAVWWREQ